MSSADEAYVAAISAARSPVETTRVKLAVSPDTAPEILFYLAKDPAVTVRAAVAINQTTPIRAGYVLASDEDERVRVLMARKLASLAPSLSGEEQEQLRLQTNKTLMRLVADEADRVRMALSDVLKEMPEAPREVILALARDELAMVSEPVIRLSPLLTSEDLVGLLAASPRSATATAVARRQGLNELVSDAVAATADVAAIQALLSNHSAAIREATLDALIAQAAEHVEWHEPLVRRPCLSPRSARRLSEIVTGALLDLLASRTEADRAMRAELRSRLEWHLDTTYAPSRSPMPAIQARATTMVAPHGPVTEPVLLDALKHGDARLATSLLAKAADVPLKVVERAATLRSTKGLVSLLWKAGFTMRAAVSVQALLTRLPPQDILGPAPGGDFPLAIDEMRWQLDFLGRTGR